MITCRGCCRPVTLNLNQNQLMLRRYVWVGSITHFFVVHFFLLNIHLLSPSSAIASLVFIYVFYTIPISWVMSPVETLL
jgi:hypothetical protein